MAVLDRLSAIRQPCWTGDEMVNASESVPFPVTAMWVDEQMVLMVSKSFGGTPMVLEYSGPDFTLFASPGRPVHSDTNPASPGSILARQQLWPKLNHSHFDHCLQPGIHLYSGVNRGVNGENQDAQSSKR